MLILFIISATIALIAFTVYIFKRDKWTLRVFLKSLLVFGLVILSFAVIYLSLPEIYNINSFTEAIKISYENTFQISIAKDMKTENIFGISIVLLHKSFSLLIVIFALSIIKEKVQELNKSKE